MSSVPLPELAAAAPLDHIEAVTIVRDVAQRVARGEFSGAPSAHVIRLSASGALSVEGPIAADGSAVRRVGHLLETLLPGFDARVRVPGALRLIVARALGTLDLPPYPSLESFADALSRFAARDPVECFRQIVASRPEAPDDARSVVEAIATARDLTITVSDIRRARRATGMPLSEISRRSSVPRHLLRELEWGYFENWPASHVGRRLIISYARAAGLDEQLVARTVWPLLAECAQSRDTIRIDEPHALPIVVDITPVEREGPAGVTSTSLARIEPVVRPRWDARRVVAVLTIPALFAIGAAPAIREHSAAARRDAQHQVSASRPHVGPQPVATAEVRRPVQETEVMVATPTVPGKPVRTSGASFGRQRIVLRSLRRRRSHVHHLRSPRRRPRCGARRPAAGARASGASGS